MSTTEARPVISDEEFDEDVTVRLSGVNALIEMFHELKDKFESLKIEKTMEAMTPKSGDASDQMTSLQCFNSKDMMKPDQYDMEPGTLGRRSWLGDSRAGLQVSRVQVSRVQNHQGHS